MSRFRMSLRIIERVLLITLLALALFLGGIIAYIVTSLSSLEAIEKLESFRNKIPTKVYDVNGELFAEFFYQKREIIPFEQVPRHMINALVAMEDNSFYSHSGIDLWGMTRALLVDIFAGGAKQGGSTITQQLAKRLFTESEKTLARKVREIWYAIQIEKKYSKNEILERYCNEIYFGHGAYGIESASQIFFQKPARDMDIAECALLAALPSAPNFYSPLAFPNRARQRQRLVLLKMVEMGYITRAQADLVFEEFWAEFSQKNLSPTLSAWNIKVDRAPYFTEYVRQQLVNIYGGDRVNEDGLRVYTTMDLRMQLAAEAALNHRLDYIKTNYQADFKKFIEEINEKHLDQIDLVTMLFDIPSISLGGVKAAGYVNRLFDESFKAPLFLVSLFTGIRDLSMMLDASYNYDPQSVREITPEGAIVAIDPRNGYIKTLVGGSGFSPENRFHRAVQAYRQPGSAFKPFVYLAAIESKMLTAGTPMDDSPVAYHQANGRLWFPRNYSRHYAGRVPLKTALRNSVNIITIKILNLIGYERVTSMAARLMHIPPTDIEKRFVRAQSLALGGSEVTPLELCLGFAIFANNGQDVKPLAIVRVLDRDGKLIDDFVRKRDFDREGNRIPNQQMVEAAPVYVLTDMLRNYSGPVKMKDGRYRDLAGKTGTTSNWKDAWFGAYTPQLAAAVWLGFDDPGISLGARHPAASIAAPTLMKFFETAMEVEPEDGWFPFPSGVAGGSVCMVSGRLPTTFCRDTTGVYFLTGTGVEGDCEDCKRAGSQLTDIRLTRFGAQSEDDPGMSITGPRFDEEDLFRR